MLGQVQVKVGQRFSCTYPKHGVKNILCNQAGVVESYGVKKGNQWLCIRREDGSFRTLHTKKMVNPVIS